MSKKTVQIAFILIFLSMLVPTTLFASNEGRRDDLNGFQRSMSVMGRGLLNIVGFPAEIYATPARETETHPRLWPVTMVPRLITNIIFRATSAVNDTLISPIFIAPYTSDISPMTEPMGLPDYPWEVD